LPFVARERSLGAECPWSMEEGDMRRKGPTTGLWLTVVVLMVLVAMPSWGAAVPKAKFAKNAGKLDGLDSTAFAQAGHTHPPGDAATLDGFDTSAGSAPGSIYVSDAQGDLPSNTVDGQSIDNVVRIIPIPIHELDTPFTTGTFPDKTMVGQAPALAFDAATDETVSFAVPFPSVGVASSTTSMRLIWSIAAVSGSVRWGYAARFVGDGEAVDTGGTTTSLAGEDFAVSGISDGRSSALFSLASVLSPGDTLFMSVFRDADGAGDTAVGHAHLHAIEFIYTAEQ
jgi:hypothetical protein